MSIIITGANGYIGKSLCKHLIEKKIFFKTVTRCGIAHNYHHNQNIICNFSGSFNLESELENSDCIIHLASSVHNNSSFKSEDYRKVNVEATKRLAEQAARVKLRSFIFMSSASVFGQNSKPEAPFFYDSDCFPVTDYGLSKLAAETALRGVCKCSELAYTIIRPPMVYGKHAPGNWEKMIRLLRYGLPMPFGSINNLRSFIFINNLLSLIELIITSRKAENKIFLVSDGCDISTTELINEIRTHKDYNFKNFKMNNRLLNLVLRASRLHNESKQLLSNMQLDITHTKLELDWTPPFDAKDSIGKSI